MSGQHWFSDWRGDVRYAWRGIRHDAWFALMVVVTLGLGIGANAAMFGIIDRLLLHGPAHVRDAGRVMRLYGTTTQPGMGGERTVSSMGYVTYALLRDNARSFEQVAAYRAIDATFGRGENAEKIKLGKATHDFFPLLGVRALRGRFWTAVEDRPPAGQNVAVIGHGFWKSRFGGDVAAIGREIEVEGEQYTIIGIAPEGFTGAELAAVDVWTPNSTGIPIMDDWEHTWGASWLQVMVRLKPGVMPEQAAQDANIVYRNGYTGHEKSRLKTMKLSLAPLRYTGQGVEQTEIAVSRWLVGVASVVLLIACANVANLLLARTIRRRREVAVRAVLGIGRGRLLRLLLTETMMLALLGGVVALLVAQWGGQFVRLVLLPNVEWTEGAVNPRVLGFTALVTIVTGLVIALAPLVQAGAHDLSSALRTGAREGGGRGAPLRAGLSVAQAALSVVLLIGAGLFVHSLWRVANLDLGIQPQGVLAVSANFAALPDDATAEMRRADTEREVRFYERATERLAGLHEIEGVAMASGTPFSSSYVDRLHVPGYDSLPRLPGGGPYKSAASANYFTTVHTRLLQGRVFKDSDRAGSEPVSVVNRTMAQTLWPNTDAVGQCIRPGADTMPCARIVGVVEDARRFSIRDEPAMQYYVPLGQEGRMGARMLLVRPRAGDAAVHGLIRRELLALDPGVRFIESTPLGETLDNQMRPWRLGATLFGLFGALALLIAGIGLYSVVSYMVMNRGLEWGVRMALGAQPADLLRLILRQGLATVVLGLAIGVAVAFSSARFLQPLLFDTTARNPFIYVGVTAVLLTVGVVASIIPAHRATRVPPARALRAE